MLFLTFSGTRLRKKSRANGIITKKAKAEAKFIRQSGGRGQYGHVFLEIEPLERGKGFVFENKIVGGAIPKEFITDESKAAPKRLFSAPVFKKDGEKLKVDYKIGDFVEHKMWGRGQVLNVKKLSDDTELDVHFSNIGLKHLLVSFAPLQKVEKE